MNQSQHESNRLFIGVYPCGIQYADRHREENGDYANLAFLSFDTLELAFKANCPDDLRQRITADATGIQAQQGQQYRTSTAGQTVLLGSKLAKPSPVADKTERPRG